MTLRYQPTMLRFIAPRLGAVPPDQAVIAGRKLPPGQQVTPDPDFADSKSDAPVLWVSRRPEFDAAAAAELRRTFSEHGLWPVVLSSLRGEDERPWLAGELNASGHSAPDSHDVLRVLTQQWNDVLPVEDEGPEALEVVSPFGRRFPGLAAPAAGSDDRNVLEEVSAALEGRLGLVPATRPADVPSTAGWMGPINHYSDMGMLGAVLASWEDRYGAFVVGVGFDTLTLAVLRPPRDRNHALGIAAEHFAMCSDNVYQGAGTLSEYAESLIDQNAWQFWWD
jgi:hypothetical protein